MSSYAGFRGSPNEREMVGPDPSLFSAKCKVQQLTQTTSTRTGGQGDVTVAFEAETYAYWRNRPSREFVDDETIVSEASAELILNYRDEFADLDASWRVEDEDGKHWNVTAVEFPFGRKRYPLLRVSHVFKRA